MTLFKLDVGKVDDDIQNGGIVPSTFTQLYTSKNMEPERVSVFEDQSSKDPFQVPS